MTIVPIRFYFHKITQLKAHKLNIAELYLGQQVIH